MPASSSFGRRLRDPLNLVALLVAVVWGGVALFLRPIGDFGVETDFYGDARYAREWMSGHVSLMSGFRGPFYHLVLGGLSTVVGDAFLTGKILSFVSAAVGIRLLGALLRRLWGYRAALAGILFVAAVPVFIEYSYRADTDLFFWALFLAALVLLFSEGTERSRTWLWAGLLAGCAYLTRYNGVVLVPGGLAVALIVSRPIKRGGALFAMFLLGWVLMVSPWAGYVWSQTGNPFWNLNYENAAIEVYTADAGLAQQGRFMGAVDFGSAADVVRVDPVGFTTAMAKNIPHHFLHDAKELVGWPLAALALLGFGLGWRGWRGRRVLAFGVVGLLTFLSLLPAFYNPRFMLPLLPWWGAAAAGTVHGLSGWFRHRQEPSSRPERKRKGSAKSGKPRRVPAGGTLVLGVFSLVAVISTARGVVQSQDPFRHGGLPTEYLKLRDLLQASEWHFDETTPIAARKPHLGYLLGAPVVPIQEGGQEQLRASGAHYLLVSGIEVSSYPSLRPLWDPKQGYATPPGLRLVARVSAPMRKQDGVRMAALYAVEDPLPYTVPKARAAPTVPPPPVGFSHLDHLRYQIVDWSVAWNNPIDVHRLLGALAPSLRRDPRVLLLTGDVVLEEGDLDAAKEQYRAALEQEPDHERALLSLAGIAALTEETQELEQYAQRFLDLRGPSLQNSVDGWLQVGAAYGAERRHAAALAPLFIAYSQAPDHIDVLRRLAYTVMELRRKADAEVLLRQGLQLSPGDGELQSLLESLQR